MVVQHNLTAMNSNRMLNLTVKSQTKSTEKLSSGYKINRAADDAAGLSISEKMRKQIRGLTQASSNAQDGISAVQTAEGALNEVQDMLQRMNELAVKAANGTNSEEDRDYIQAEVDQLVTEIDRVATTTKFNESYLLKGTSKNGNVGELTFDTAGAIQVGGAAISGTANFDVSGVGALGTTTYTAAKATGITNFTAKTNEIQVGTTTYIFVQDVAGAAATNVDDAAAKFNATANTKAFTSMDDMLAAIKKDNASNIKELSAAKTAGADTFDIELTAFADTNDNVDLSLHVGADSSKDNKIGLSVHMMSARFLGVNGIRVDGQTSDNATGAIDTIASALQAVSEQRSTLGAVQNRLEHTINNLDNIVENTTAAESAIRDTDMASEMVKYSNNNILAQAGQAMLAQANQANQGVLSLLG